MNKTIQFKASDISVTSSTNDHSNRLRFKASVMYVDKYSDGTPCGADGSCIMLPREEALAKAETMNFMGIDCEWDEWSAEYSMTGHNPRFKIGVVEKCYVENDELKIEGSIYKNDFPDIAFFIKNAMDSLGFSVEVLCNVDESEEGYILKDVEFTGVAMLFKETASYKETYIEYLSAKDTKADKRGDLKPMTEQEKLEMSAEIAKAVKAELKAEAEKENKVKAEEALKKENEDLKAEVKNLKAELEKAKKAEEEKEAKDDKKDEPKDVDASDDSFIPSDLKTKTKFQASEEPKTIGAMFANFLGK